MISGGNADAQQAHNYNAYIILVSLLTPPSLCDNSVFLIKLDLFIKITYICITVECTQTAQSILKVLCFSMCLSVTRFG